MRIEFQPSLPGLCFVVLSLPGTYTSARDLASVRRAGLFSFAAGAAQKEFVGERGWIRTSDPRLKRALLYQLSYAPTLLLI